MIYRKELEEKGRVCPSCDFHFTVPGKERIAMTLINLYYRLFAESLESRPRHCAAKGFC